MKKVVLDASVIIKWFLEEKQRKAALLFRGEYQRGTREIYVPSLLLFEVANTFVHKSSIPLKDCQVYLEELIDLDLKVLVFSAQNWQEVAQVARDCRVSVYDAVYVVLAKNLDCEFITADKKLFQKTKTFSFIKLLS